MNTMILAIDPGNIESGYVLMDSTYKPLEFGKVENHKLLYMFTAMEPTDVVIEMIGHYGTGMAAGASVFDTCVWIGRFIQLFYLNGLTTSTLMRGKVKMQLCGSMRAKDPNVTQALIDRFAPYEKNMGKGNKKKPGWFYGFAKDVWQAYALGVVYLDMKKEEEGK